jgi:hypothetical protein
MLNPAKSMKEDPVFKKFSCQTDSIYIVFGKEALHRSKFANAKPFHLIGKRVEFLGCMIANGSDRDRASEVSHSVRDFAGILAPTCNDADTKVFPVRLWGVRLWGRPKDGQAVTWN